MPISVVSMIVPMLPQGHEIPLLGLSLKETTGDLTKITRNNTKRYN